MKFRSLVGLFLFFIMILFNINVFALSGVVNDTSVRIRSGAGTTYVSLSSDAFKGHSYTLLDPNLYPTSDGSTGCASSLWYKIFYNNGVGYICSDYLDVNSSSSDDSTVGTIDLSSTKGVIACYEDATTLNLKNAPNGSSVKGLECGDVVEIVDTDVSSDDRCYSWYKVKSDNTTGYVCGKFITTKMLSKTALNYYNNNSLEEYNKSLRDAGFPDSYLPYLDELHARYPSWKFEALKTNMDYSTVTSLESAVGISLVQNDPLGYRSTAGGSYNYYTDSFNALDGTSWFAANHATVSYYMDPRLYLKPNYVFMFEKLTYDANYHTVDKVQNLLSSTKILSYDLNAANYYMEAAAKFNVSPIHLASRTRQEIGSSTAVISGDLFSYNGRNYSGLFNAYNIGAYSGADNWKKGLVYANGGEDGTNKSTSYGRPWNTLQKAIIGGAEFITNGYINNNQYTDYLQKFNVINGQDMVGSHQYMTNLRAPLGEASITYNNYKSFNILNNEFVFSIPVYSNMEDMYVLPNPGNPNNYLREIKINDSIVTGFDGGISSYDVYVSSTTSSVKLSGVCVNSGALVSGSINGIGAFNGNVNINEGSNAIDIVVTAVNGSVRKYTINVIREKAIEVPKNTDNKEDISSIITSSGYSIKNDYVDGFYVGMTATELINSLKKVDANLNVTVKDSKGNDISNGMITTGSTLQISKNGDSANYVIVVYGDVNGDGKVDALDLLKVQKHILGLSNLTGVNLISGNANRDDNNNIDALDLLKVQKHILGLSTIKQ